MLKTTITYSVFFVMCLLLLASCSSVRIEEQKESPEVENDMLQSIQSECELVLPEDTSIIYHGDGGRGGGTESEKYYNWLLKSAEKIEIPQMYEYENLPYYEEPLDSALYAIQCKIPSQKLSKPLEAIGSKFETRERIYKYHRLKTKDGYYLLVERFQRLPTPLSKASMPEIIKLIKNGNHDERISAIQELHLCKADSASIILLIGILTDSDEEIRRHASIALKQLTRQKGIGDSHSEWQKWWKANKARILKNEAGKEPNSKKTVKRKLQGSKSGFVSPGVKEVGQFIGDNEIWIAYDKENKIVFIAAYFTNGTFERYEPVFWPEKNIDRREEFCIPKDMK